MLKFLTITISVTSLFKLVNKFSTLSFKFWDFFMLDCANVVTNRFQLANRGIVIPRFFICESIN